MWMKQKVMNQLSIDFDPEITTSYSTCVEYVQHRVHSLGRQQKSVAADMDLSPSHLSRKLAQSPNDSMRLTVDDLERYMKETGDYEPAIYLAAKFIYKGSEASLRKQIAELQAKLNTVT